MPTFVMIGDKSRHNIMAFAIVKMINTVSKSDGNR